MNTAVYGDKSYTNKLRSCWRNYSCKRAYQLDFLLFEILCCFCVSPFSIGFGEYGGSSRLVKVWIMKYLIHL